ncbi:sigma-70 family RNA polymerase sigma factor [Sphingomonas faeni]|uniref:sigma-70 family RNA polymerase sigma factor n=1 Tax=Sphingomonas faeni TaxID=185950 RepID=UPI002787ACD4|nr:sigma-70 family RNA polymerase sigma factor [Sphingomonas faeni]MDQ0839955.1 RNA polymerase sigma-70 factor (ECF subfamily) [Sphingomonas faeni]
MKPSDPDVLKLLPTLLRYARSLTHDEAAAEDLVHETLLIALAENGSYQAAHPLRQWLFAILHNRFISDLRRRKTRERHAQEVADATDPVVAPGQELSLALKQTEAGVRALPEDQRAALHLVVVEGLSYAEAASALDIPIGTLMSRISLARARLRNPQSAGLSQGTVPSLRVVKR